MKKRNLFICAVLGLIGFGVYAHALQVESLGFIAPTIVDKSNVYSPQVGEIVYDSSDSTFYGRTQGSNWVSLTAGSSIVPAGSLLPYAGTSAPSGYLLCDGRAVSRTTYANLFAVIGTAYGNGDGSTTFNLPDLRGRFLRGVSGTSGNDPDASSRTAISGGNTGNNIGSYQSDDFKSHTHNMQAANATAGSGVAAGSTLANAGSAYTVGGTPTLTPMYSTVTSTGGSETRPVNVYVNYIIKI